MKKTLAAVLAAGALFIGGIGSVDAANWYTVGTDSNGITWSIDNDSVKKDDKKATLDIKAMDYEGYHYIVTEEFNHKKREVKDVKVTLYNPKGEVVKQENLTNLLVRLNKVLLHTLYTHLSGVTNNLILRGL